MLTPSILAVIRRFYAVGNTPAASLTRHLPQGADADLLLLGCGDVRNILFTVHSNQGFPARKLDITCCDIEDAILARNALLLTLLLEKGTTTSPHLFWDAYYHLFLGKQVVSVLETHINKLCGLATSLDEWRQRKFGTIVRFCDNFTLRSARRVWSEYATALSDKDSTRYRSRVETALRKSRGYAKGTVSYAAVRAAAPLGVPVLADADMKTVLDTWWERGTIGSQCDTARTPNPLFAATLSDNFLLHGGSEPLIGFHLAAARAHLAEVSPLKLPDAGEAHLAASSLAATAQLQFSEWVKAFVQLTSANIVIRFIAADAFALCHTLQHQAAEGASSANFYQRQLSPERLQLDAAEYSEGGAPSKFDAHWATLYTETMDKGIDGEKSKFDELLCGPAETVSSLLGISPAEYWTNATATSHIDEYMLAAATSQRPSEQPSIQWRFAWKSNSHLSGHRSGTRLRVSEDDLAALIYKVYQGMFPNENPMAVLSLSKKQQLESVRKQTYPRYHRGSLVVFIKRLLQAVDANTESVCKIVLAKISSDATLMFGSNFQQALSLQISDSGLFSEDWLTEAIRRGPGAGVLATWADIPKGVYITTIVPKDSWKWVCSAALADGIGFAVEGSMRCAQGGIAAWYNLFPDVHIIFGTVETSGARDSAALSVSVKEDTLGWAGDSSMIATFRVPAVAVQLDPKNTRVGLCVQNGVQNVAKLKAKGRLGQEMQISDAALEDRDRVYITKCPPGQNGPPRYSSLKPTEPVHVEYAEGSSHCLASLDASGRITSLTSRFDIVAPEGRDLLKNKSDIAVHQTSPFAFQVDVANGDTLCSLRFPVPVEEGGSRTRIARASGYVEVIAPPASPGRTKSLDDFLYPTTLAPSGSATGQLIPVTLTIPHLNLDSLPILDASDKQRLSFLTTLASWTFSNRERKLREQTVGSSQSGLPPSARLNFKESLFTMFMLASGLQGGQTGLFAINHPEKGGIHMLIFVSAIRLDGANASVALDAAVIPLTVDTIKSGALESFLLVLRTLECCTVTVDDDELVLWKKVLPALVERCRTWSHTRNCEYARPGATVPLSTEPGKQVICSCGTGRLPEKFVGVPEWETAAKFATRMAISPTYAVPFVEEVVDLSGLKGAEKPLGLHDSLPRCRSCGASHGKNGRALKKCTRCLEAHYCCVECQKKDWEKHRMECAEATPAWEAVK